ncbi:DoxX family protein [Pseudopedobacter beijingensis]|uniref:DoxX family protein n=1 Tax=Pseudopedobacter beijingensis TaxID=1207056 RepID=A0ABW4ICJ4_9SPHI
MASTNFFKNRDFGILIIRVGLGICMVMHGLPKITGGMEKWKAIGGAMNTIGIDFAPTFWGFMASAVETFGGFLLVLGLFFRPANALLAFTMLIAALVHINKGEGFMGASHAIEIGIAFLGLIFIGPGKYSIDKK